MKRLAVAAAFVIATWLLPAGTAGTEPLRDSRPPDAAFASVELGPLEQVVPVPVPSPSPTVQEPIAGLHWPKLHLGETGVVSTYGPGYRGYLALPYPYCGGWHVTISGPGGSVERVSNDCGPERRLLRLADLDVPTFEAVCGVPWRFGLCVATVQVTGRVK